MYFHRKKTFDEICNKYVAKYACIACMASVPKQKFFFILVVDKFPYALSIFCSNLCLARMLKKVLCPRTLATQATKNLVCMGISEIWTTSNLISVMASFDNLKTKDIK